MVKGDSLMVLQRGTRKTRGKKRREKILTPAEDNGIKGVGYGSVE